MLLPDQMDEFAMLTLKTYTKEEWIDISLQYQDFCFAELLGRGDPDKNEYRKGKMVKRAEPEDGGESLSWRVQVRNTGSFRNTGMYSVNNTQVRELMVPADVPWTKQECSFGWDVDELVMQSSRTKIIDILTLRRHSMFNDFFEGMEINMWSQPGSDTSDPRPPFGIPHWVQSSTTAAFGFNGGNPSGFASGCAGINADTYTGWKNGTFTYNAIQEDDALSKLAEAVEKCRFKAPHNYKEIGGKGAPDYMLYTVWAVKNEFQKLAKSQNDQVGLDVGEYRKGEPVFKGIPVRRVAALDTAGVSLPDGTTAYDADDPIYGINWKKAKYVFHKARKMQVTKPKEAPVQQSVREVFLINWGNFRFDSRRDHFVAKRASAS